MFITWQVIITICGNVSDNDDDRSYYCYCLVHMFWRPGEW